MKVFWTKFALNSLSEIYRYYRDNVSLAVAANIRNAVVSSARQLTKHPNSGQIEESLTEFGKDHRYIIRANYKIIYKIQNQRLYITDVFDMRQNPEKIIARNK